MNRIVPLLLLTVAGTAFGQTSFQPLAAAIRAQALNLPAETPLVVLTPADKSLPKQSYTISRTFAPDGTFTVAWKGPQAQSVQTFRPDGTLRSSRQTDSGKKTSLTQDSDGPRTTVRTLITVDGRVKSDKTSPLKAEVVLRDELQHLVLQAWLYGVRDGLKFQSLSPDGGMVGDFQIQFREVKEVTALSDKYTYPEEFRTALRGRGPFLVADMNLLGVGAFFYPHHFYLLYTVTAQGLRFEAYFGEDPKAPVFQYTPR